MSVFIGFHMSVFFYRLISTVTILVGLMFAGYCFANPTPNEILNRAVNLNEIKVADTVRVKQNVIMLDEKKNSSLNPVTAKKQRVSERIITPGNEAIALTLLVALYEEAENLKLKLSS